MLWKPAEPFLSITPSGCPQLYAWEMMHLQLTLRWPLGQNLQLGHMVQLETQPQTFCSSKGLVQSPVGLMITYSSGSHVVHLQSTTRNAGHGMETSYPEVSTKMEVESGSEEGDLRMEHLKNSTKTAPFLARTFQCPQIDQQKIGHTPTTLMILTLHHGCWGSHGRSQRTDPLLVQQPTSVLTGTSKPIEYLWQIARKRNTSQQQRIGFHKLHICLKRWRNSTANSYMHALLGPLDKHISQSWSACLEYSTIVHSYHSPRGLQKDLEWWVNEPWQPILSTTIPQPVSPYNLDTFSDASFEFGIMITIGDKWRAWCLIPGWKTLDGQQDTRWAEAIAFECLVRYLTNTHRKKQHFLVHGDNRGVVEGWWNGRSCSRPINKVFKRLHEFS